MRGVRGVNSSARGVKERLPRSHAISSTLQMITAMMKSSNGCDCTTLNSARRADCRGGSSARAPFLFIESDIVSVHCRCSAVIVAEPSFSFLIWVKVSTIAPMNRLRLKKQPTKIHATK